MIKAFFKPFFLQLIVYSLATWNWRMVAIGNYYGVFTSDIMFATFNFWIIKDVAKSESKISWAGYTLGGAIGSLIAIYFTKKIYGK